MDFEKLVESHYAPLYRFAFSLTGNADDACDLTQQTFFIWAGKGSQLLDPTKVKSWLFTTLHREFLSRRRKALRFAEMELDEEHHSWQETEAFPFERVDRSALLQAFGCMDERYKAAVALFYLEDYSYPEIAAILDVPLGTVKSRIARGIAQLQELLIKPRRPAERDKP